MSKCTYQYLHQPNETDTPQVWMVYFDFYPGYPARLGGLPENCYPGEDPEIEIYSITDMDDEEIPKSVFEADKSIMATIENEIHQAHIEYRKCS